MFNVYRRISQKSFNGTRVLYKKARINSYEIDAYNVGEWFKSFAKSLADKYDVRAISTTAFNLSVSVLTKDGKNLIFEFWADATGVSK